MVPHSFMVQIFTTGTESYLGTVMVHLLVVKVALRLLES